MDAALVANLLLAAAQTFDSLTTCRLVNLEQFGDVLDRLSDRLIVEGNVPSCDILEGWKLHSINNTVVSSPDAHALQCPRVKGGQVSLLFFEYGGRFVRPNSDCAFTAKLFLRSISEQVQVPLVVAPTCPTLCAADAFASRDRAGIGGFWLPADADGDMSQARWFSLQFSARDLPAWFRCAGGSGFQGCIAAFEALAQLVLVALRARESGYLPEGFCLVQFAQLCDNQAVSACSVKMLTMKEPLCFVLQALGYWACRYRFQLQVSHIAGERNSVADELSRGRTPDFLQASYRQEPDVIELLQAPWDP